MRQGQNLLIAGINERGRFCLEEGGKWQGLRILLTSLISLYHCSQAQNMNARFVFLQNSPDLKPGSKGTAYLQQLNINCELEILRSTDEQLQFVENILEQVKNKQVNERIFIFVEGQDYYRLDRELKTANDVAKDEESKLFSFGSKPFGGVGGQKQTVRDAWLKI